MKCTICILIAALFSCHVSHGRQLDELMRGVYLSGKGNVDLDQIADTLHLNTVQFATGYGYQYEDAVLRNTKGVRVINTRRFLDSISWGQRMEYKAYQEAPPAGEELLKNYFAGRHPDIRIDSAHGEEVLYAPGTPGLMVWSAQPNDQYHLDADWWATFRLRVEGSHPSGTNVVRCIVYCLAHNDTLKDSLLTFGSFGTGNEKDFVLPFSLAEEVARSGVSSMCTNVDLRVYWYGNVTTYMDRIVVENGLGRDLFSGVYDRRIKREAKRYSRSFYPNHSRFLLVDEPWVSQYSAFHYVADRIKDTLGNIPSAGCVTPTTRQYKRFLTDAQPSYLIIDPYFVFSDIPHPGMSDADADANGIARWDYAAYTSNLQKRLDFSLGAYVRPAVRALQSIQPDSLRPPLIYVPQFHGIWYWQGGRYLTPDNQPALRPPSPSEIRLAYNMGLAYGAKGFLAFIYTTNSAPFSYNGKPSLVLYTGLVSDTLVNGYSTYHGSNYISEKFSGGTMNTWTGSKDNWNEVASINRHLEQIGDTIISLTWVGAKSWSTTQTPSGNWSGLVTSVASKDTLGIPDPTPFAEVGELRRGIGAEYIIVVNRRASTRSTGYDTRDISLELTARQPNWRVTDIETQRAWTVQGGHAFTDRFQPGEGKIYRLVSTH